MAYPSRQWKQVKRKKAHRLPAGGPGRTIGRMRHEEARRKALMSNRIKRKTHSKATLHTAGGKFEKWYRKPEVFKKQMRYALRQNKANARKRWKIR